MLITNYDSEDTYFYLDPPYARFSDEKNDLPIMLKDIKSLIDHTNFNFERLDYLQNIFIGILSRRGKWGFFFIILVI